MPSTFGRYRVVRPVGEGAMAAVFEVEDTALGGRRALKVLHPEVAANTDLRARFDAEARTMAQLRHPHLVAVHDVGESEGRPWMVMDLAEGGSLADRVTREGALDACVVLGEMLGVLDALAVVHAAGVIHRDVKPQNLLYDGAGVLRLADFGIALTEGLELTRTGMVLGSWGFMAPEQRLDPRKVRPATDLFGLAASAVWAIVGAPVSDLHVGEHRAVLLRDVSDDVSGVLHRSLAFRPEERFRSAGEMRAAILEVLGAAAGGGGAAEGTEEGLTQRNRGTEERQQEGGGTAGGMAGGAFVRGRASVASTVDSGGGEVAAPPFHVGPRNAPAFGGAFPPMPRGVVLGGFLVAVGVAGIAGGWVTLHDAVRDRFVTENDSVRQARALAALPVCPDTPTRWERRGSPRWSTSVAGGREAGGGIASDIDGDGNKDLLFVHALEEEFRVYWGTGSDFDDTPTRVPAQRMALGRPHGGAAGDIDGDGDLDLIGLDVEGHRFVITRNLGNRTFSAVSVVDNGGVLSEVQVIDWDFDGRDDLLFTTAAFDQRTLHWRRSLADGTFDTMLDLHEHVDSFDLDVSTSGPPRGVYLLDGDEVLYAARRPDGRLEESSTHTKLPISGMNALRNGTDRLLVWDTLLRVRDALGVPHNGGAPCSFTLPAGPAMIQDLTYFDEDSSVDAIVLTTCSYCTSSYAVYLGNR